jgi:hypothetical protein
MCGELGQDACVERSVWMADCHHQMGRDTTFEAPLMVGNSSLDHGFSLAFRMATSEQSLRLQR